MSTPFAAALANNLVSPAELTKKYAALQSIILEVLGVVPTVGRYLDIWPPGYRTYSLLVSRFLNLPLLLFGFSAPKATVGLVMYVASCKAKCAYCIMHSCAFALRRGAHVDTITGDTRTPPDAAAVAMAEALSVTPHTHTTALRTDLELQFGSDHADWLAMAVAVTEVESEVPGQVAHPDVDSVGTLLRVFRASLGVMRLEGAWTNRVPSAAGLCRAYVKEHCQWDEPVLSAMRHPRARVGLAVALQENLDPARATLDVGCKALAAVVFATDVQCETLRKRAEKLADGMGVQSDAVRAAADGSGAHDECLDELQAVVVRLARLLVGDSARFEGEAVKEATALLAPSQLVEIIVWMALLQPIYRLGACTFAVISNTFRDPRLPIEGSKQSRNKSSQAFLGASRRAICYNAMRFIPWTGDHSLVAVQQDGTGSRHTARSN
eukprot:IDg7874t1